jgi:hypothetical protein
MAETILIAVDSSVPEQLKHIRNELSETRKMLGKLNLSQPSNEYLTAEQFMKTCSIGRWKFDALRNEGLLETKKLGRKWYVKRDQIQRFFDGLMVLK